MVERIQATNMCELQVVAGGFVVQVVTAGTVATRHGKRQQQVVQVFATAGSVAGRRRAERRHGSRQAGRRSRQNAGRTKPSRSAGETVKRKHGGRQVNERKSRKRKTAGAGKSSRYAAGPSGREVVEKRRIQVCERYPAENV